MGHKVGGVDWRRSSGLTGSMRASILRPSTTWNWLRSLTAFTNRFTQRRKDGRQDAKKTRHRSLRLCVKYFCHDSNTNAHSHDCRLSRWRVDVRARADTRVATVRRRSSARSYGTTAERRTIRCRAQYHQPQPVQEQLQTRMDARLLVRREARRRLVTTP